MSKPLDTQDTPELSNAEIDALFAALDQALIEESKQETKSNE